MTPSTLAGDRSGVATMGSDPKGSPAKPGPTRPFGVKPCAAKVVYAGELKAAMTIDHPEQRDPTPGGRRRRRGWVCRGLHMPGLIAGLVLGLLAGLAVA